MKPPKFAPPKFALISKWSVVALLALSGCTSDSPASTASDSGLIFEISSNEIQLLPAAAATPKSGAQAVGFDGANFTISDPSRIVALAPGSAEIIFALGYGEHLVGRDTTDNISELSEIEIVTETHSANLEKILAVNPTLVIVDSNSRPLDVIEKLLQADIQVALIPIASSVETAGIRIQEIAKILGDQSRADALNQSLTTTTFDKTKVRAAFLYLRGQSAVYLLGGTASGADAMITSAGGIDVGMTAGLAAFTPLTPESLAALNPNVIIVMSAGLQSVGGVDGLLNLPGVAQTDAAKNKSVISIEDSLFLSFGARTSQVIQKLNSAFVQISSTNA